MKKGMRFFAVAAAVIGVVAFIGAAQVRADDEDAVAGYLQDVENFPDMLHTVPDCADVYSDFLTVAQQLQACNNLDDAKSELAAQQSLSKQLGEVKGCKSCKKQMVQADEAAMAYQDNIDAYGKQCPSNRSKLLANYAQEVKLVCKKCKNKWPGKLGPQDKTPCN